MSNLSNSKLSKSNLSMSNLRAATLCLALSAIAHAGPALALPTPGVAPAVSSHARSAFTPDPVAIYRGRSGVLAGPVVSDGARNPGCRCHGTPLADSAKAARVARPAFDGRRNP